MARKLAWHRSVLTSRGLTALAKNVAGVLLHHLNAKTGDCWPSQSEVADMLGVTRRAVQLSLDALAAAGFIRVKGARGRGHRNRYEAVFPVDAAPEKANGGSHQTEEKANPDSKKGESSFAQESLIESLNPPFIPPRTPDDAFRALKRLWPFPADSPAWIYARSSFTRCVASGEFDLPAFVRALPDLRNSLGKDDPPSPQQWIIRRAWRDSPQQSEAIVPFAPPIRKAA